MKKRSPPSIRSIIDQQFHRWSTQNQERLAAVEGAPAHWPIVTVSREFGSLGARVGELAAERLGFTFWDQELVTTIAEETGVQEALLSSLDESSRSKVEAFVADLFFGTAGAATDYVRHLARVIRTLDRKGGAVVVGRGGQFIVEPEHALRVRVACPRPLRVAGYAEREGLAKRDAERAVDAVEKDRETFIRQHYAASISDPANYDIVVNSATLPANQAARLVVEAYRAKFGRLPPRAEQPSPMAD